MSRRLLTFASNEWEHLKNEKSHWSKINIYFHMGVLRFFLSWFLIAPFAVGILDRLPQEICLTPTSVEYCFQLTLPFNWFVLWLASLFYAVAFAFSIWGSPVFVKRYPNFADYKEVGHSPRWLVWEIYYALKALDEHGRDRLTERLIKKEVAKQIPQEKTDMLIEKPNVHKDGTEWFFEKNQRTYRILINETCSEDKVKDVFWEIQGRYAASNFSGRMVALLLLLASMLCVLFVVFQNIYFVVRYLFNGGI